MGMNLIPLTCLKMPNRTLEVLKFRVSSTAVEIRGRGTRTAVLGWRRTVDRRFSSRQSASRTEADGGRRDLVRLNGGRSKSLKSGRNIIKRYKVFSY